MEGGTSQARVLDLRLQFHSEEKNVKKFVEDFQTSWPVGS